MKRRKPQCRWICRNGGGDPGYTNCGQDSGHDGPHLNHAGYGKHWTWVLGPHIRRKTVRARIAWVAPPHPLVK